MADLTQIIRENFSGRIGSMGLELKGNEYYSNLENAKMRIRLERDRYASEVSAVIFELPSMKAVPFESALQKYSGNFRLELSQARANAYSVEESILAEVGIFLDLIENQILNTPEKSSRNIRQAAEDQDYITQLRRYVRKHAKPGTPVRKAMNSPEFKELAEAFLKETGGNLEDI